MLFTPKVEFSRNYVRLYTAVIKHKYNEVFMKYYSKKGMNFVTPHHTHFLKKNFF
jgi:hypothetical protein